MKYLHTIAVAGSVAMLICLPILLGMSVPGGLFGCALGGGGGFDCEIMLPMLVTGAVVGLISGIIISRAVVKTKTFKNSKIALIVFAIAVFGPFIAIQFRDAYDREQRREAECELYWRNCTDEEIAKHKEKYGSWYMGPSSSNQNTQDGSI